MEKNDKGIEMRMNDRFLSKAKCIDTGEWVQGYYIYYPDGAGSEAREDHVIKDTIKGVMYFIDPVTLCQCTGSTDKEKNLIWENDIVKCQDVIGKVDWNETHLAFTILVKTNGNTQYYYIDEPLGEDIEVIGNIIDNSELLEVE